MAAVLFTLEELLGRSQCPVAGLGSYRRGDLVDALHLFLGDAPLFRVPPYSLAHPSEFLFYALLGVAGGCVSVLFSSSLLWLRLKYRRLPKWTLAFQPATGGLAAGVLALYSADVLGAGYAAVGTGAARSAYGTAMFILLILKLAANRGLLTAPAMRRHLLGQSLSGRDAGRGLRFAPARRLPATTAPAGAYALVGMGTTFAGVIRSPITSVVMIFELTRDYNIIVPLMISNLVAYAVARAFSHTPIYEALAIQDGVHLPQAKGQRPEPDLCW